jgi:membrane protein DedA with SNARE-associated domain
MEIISHLIEVLASWVIRVIEFFGYGGIFVLMALESANIPIPSEIIMPFSGFLASEGKFSFWVVVFVGTLGNLFGSILSYFLASFIVKNRYRISIIKLLISDTFLDKSQKYFEKYGSLSVFFSRILPVLRTFISLPAGLGKMNFLKFSFLTFLGSFIWSAILTYFGWFLGQNWKVLEVYFRKFDIAIAVGIIAGAIYWFFYHFNGKIRKKSKNSLDEK